MYGVRYLRRVDPSLVFPAVASVFVALIAILPRLEAFNRQARDLSRLSKHFEALKQIEGNQVIYDSFSKHVLFETESYRQSHRGRGRADAWFGWAMVATLLVPTTVFTSVAIRSDSDTEVSGALILMALFALIAIAYAESIRRATRDVRARQTAEKALRGR